MAYGLWQIEKRRLTISTYKRLPRGKHKPKDEFVDWTHHLAVFVRDNFRFILYIAAAAAALFVVITAGGRYRAYRVNKAADQLYEAQMLAEGSEGRLNALEEAADKYPSTPAGREAMMMAGNILFAQGKFDEAISRYETLADKSGGSPLMKIAALHRLAATQRAQGRMEDAAKTYMKAAEDPKNLSKADSMYWAARCYEDMKQYDEAGRLYRQASEGGQGDIKTLSEERLSWLVKNGLAKD